jgi:4-hydroxy-3-methylbut-2-en-1-yl diphosphate synthase IspG/GcpE
MPSCARRQFEVIKTVERLKERLAHITTPLTVSVIGCVVNGPGEAGETDIGFTGGGNGTHQVYISGLTDHSSKTPTSSTTSSSSSRRKPPRSNRRSSRKKKPGS